MNADLPTTWDVLMTAVLDHDRTLVSAAMRIATTDDRARRWFHRHWTFGVGPGAHVLVNGLLEMVCDAAEETTAPKALQAP